MEDIFWSGTPLLESVGANEPHVSDLKETIVQMLRQALIPLRAYSKSFERFTDLVNLNVENYVKYAYLLKLFIKIGNLFFWLNM